MEERNSGKSVWWFCQFLGKPDTFLDALAEDVVLETAKYPVDDQPCNLQSLYLVIGALHSTYLVSKSALRVRLIDLGLLVDARGGQRLREILSEMW